ncbi:hypothetical protein EJB05_28107, partial [Eragrostis curvula]
MGYDNKAPANGTVQFIAGDMFKFIPKADAALLKILRRCLEAITEREAGGKVIIIDALMEAGQADNFSKETQALYDFHMMHIDGVERDKLGWEKIILQAGFHDYKISLVVNKILVLDEQLQQDLVE